MIVFALPSLFQAVVARFAVEGPWLVAPVLDPPAAGVPVPNVFGWKKPEQQMLRGNRIIWVPGDDESGAVGTYLPARAPGQNPRALARLGELFTVYIVAEDKSQPENELAQYSAARALHDAWFRAVYLAAHGTYQLAGPKWVGESKERRRGAALRILGTIEAPLPDVIHDFVAADAHAEVEVEELDQTETFTTAEVAP